MPPTHVPGPLGRSAFAAAFLSLLFPGLGHVYLGLPFRALAFAAPPILIAALGAGIAIRLDQFDLVGLAVHAWFPTAIFVLNLALLAYRAAAILDAWRIATAAGTSATARPGAILVPLRPVGLAGLAAVLLVTSLAHVAVARYDLLLAHTADCIFDPERTDCGTAQEPGAVAAPTPSPTPDSTPMGTPVPDVTIPPWDGQERLNILLIGADEQGGGHNTDTLIVVSIDPATNQVALFQLPRDTVDVPLPKGHPARKVFGSVYAGKINSFYVNVRHRADLFPGTDATRGYNALKTVLGTLYGLDIKYSVEVNFDGFLEIVEALGGVTVNVQIPIVDDRYPIQSGLYRRVYIPAGMQHMTAEEALTYARSRYTTSDFDRGQRQQRILVSLRQQIDIARILPRIDTLAAALGASVRTDIPRELVPQLLGLADRIDTRAIRSYTFTPPLYQKETLHSPRGYIIQPYVDRIQAAVRDAFTANPAVEAQHQQLAGEAATVWVLNGSGAAGQASAIAGYLEFLGIGASAPNQKPDINGYTATTILAYNGAETSMPATAATLSEVFGVAMQPTADPAARVDFMIVTGKTTPSLTPPPAP